MLSGVARSFVRASAGAVVRGARPAFRQVNHVRAFSNTNLNLAKVGFAKSHEYAKLDGDVATVGISDHAQKELGDIVFVELPEVGDKCKVGKGFGAVESVKAAADVYAPVSGEVIEVNSALDDDPSLVNKSAMEDGWIIKIKVSDAGEFDKLMDTPAYEKHCAEGGH
eukprot:CAMPEP_0177716078 /NCGR_PEP_ID=MMETSP0484_2-20121128/14329_1 /TAXON_ID=354590 /ORGANISM="Rhodomonas lens, Strain RHODO" /LENGTH=166 /DNA_ID=CAMNT_0019228107 /DNA_START=27 /DNA_END=527 /DNA_ORIENTATION=+